MQPPETLETARLILRPARVGDAEAIFDTYAQDVDVTRYMTWRPHASIEETRTFLRRCERVWANGEAFPWTITLSASGELIGVIEVDVDGHSATLGYGIARPYWGRGYTSEAAQAVVDWALAQPSIFRVWAVCDVDNPASARVMAKVGMQFEGVLRRFVLHPNVSPEPRDALCYAIVK